MMLCPDWCERVQEIDLELARRRLFLRRSYIADRARMGTPARDRFSNQIWPKHWIFSDAHLVRAMKAFGPDCKAFALSRMMSAPRLPG
jgi:hypothetical protein